MILYVVPIALSREMENVLSFKVKKYRKIQAVIPTPYFSGICILGIFHPCYLCYELSVTHIAAIAI